MSFFIAMRNRRAMASYWHPQTIIGEGHEFIVVSRSGGRNEYLWISNAGACTGQEREAPSDLEPGLVIFATLVSQGLNGGEIFLIEREVPKGATVTGTHIGGDGYLLLDESGEGGVTIKGAARLRAGPRIRRGSGLCVLLEEGQPGATVHFDAVYVPWAREVLPDRFDGRRRAGPGK